MTTPPHVSSVPPSSVPDSSVPDSSVPDSPTQLLAPPGLKGVIVADTEIGDVRGSEGFYHYRHYDAIELCRSSSLEQVWLLLLEGELAAADSPRVAAFSAEVAGSRSIDRVSASVMESIAASTTDHHSGLLAALPMVLGHSTPSLDQTPAERQADLLAVVAAVPTLLASLHARRTGRPLAASDAGLGHAADWLQMATGHPSTPEQVRLMETYLTATIDHGFNASTFAARVVTSTGADVVGALSAGVAALSGPLHGGAPGRALDMIQAIGTPSATQAWVLERLERGEKIMGFGHAVYRADDPRSVLLRDLVVELGPALGQLELVERAVEIESRTLEVLRRWKPESTIVTNVEFYAGVALHLAGLSPELFTPSFTVSRAIGWSAHILEQAANNKILRPSARYVGPEPVQPEPAAGR